MAEGLPDLVSHVKLDTSTVEASAAKVVAAMQRLEKAQLQAAQAAAAVERAQVKLGESAAGSTKAALAAEKLEAAQLKAAHAAQQVEVAQSKLTAATLPAAKATETHAAATAKAATATENLSTQAKGLLTSLTGIGGGTSQLSGIFSKFGGSVGEAKSAMSGVASEGNTLKTVLTGVGVGAAGVGLALGALAVEGIGKFTSAAGEVRKLQATLGSTAEDASRLRNVAIGLGVDVDTMGKAFFKLGPILEKNQGDLAGVHVEMAKNSDGSSNLIGTLDNMRQAYQAITDPVQKSQFALDAFKKTGLELRPILSATNDQFKQLANNGPIFKQADLQAAKDLSIAQRELKQATDSAEIALAKGLVPILTQVSTAATNGVQGLQHFGEALSRVKSEGGPASVAVNGLEKAFGAVAKNITPLGNVLDLLHGGQKKTAGSAADAAEAEKKLTESLKDTADKAEAAAKAFDKLVTAQETDLDKNVAMDRALLAATRSAEGITAAELALAQAHQTVAEKQTALNKLQKDGTATAEEIKSATLDLQSAQLEEKKAAEGVTDAHNAQEDALIAAAKAVRDKKVADEEATGQAVTAEAKTRIFIAALRDQAGTLAPGSDLRKNLDDYANKLENGIPKSVNTVVTADTSQASQAIGDLERRLEYLANKGVSAENNTNLGTAGDQVAGSASSDTGYVSQDEANSAQGNILGRHGNILGRHVIPLARGGRTRGFVTAGPRFLVGEGDPRYPEVVIATDPKYRQRNLTLAAYADRALGRPTASAPRSYASGGIVSGGSTIGGPGGITISPAPVIITLDGREIARATVKFSAAESEKLARSLR